MSSLPEVQLRQLARPAGRSAGGASLLPVYSVTKHRGFVPSLEYFKKQVFSRDLSNYTQLDAGDIAYATIHLDEGSVGISPEPCLISPMYTSFRVDPDVACGPYVVRYLKSERAMVEYPRLGKGSVERRKSISFERLGELLIPLPPLPEQRRIAAILDQADALRAKRREALAKLDELTQAIFLEMFGDPATNPKGWPLRPLGELTLKFSDGPFGSNLKTEHYTETGVRVVRLQNIGVGRFLDDDRVFISGSHFEALRKHECLPGDLLIGTLGDPNLRAAILPAHVTRALNKADCVQMRPDPTAATADYLCGLLNLPAVEGMAQSLVLGQTRLRISMGRLRGLRVPVPPVKLQLVFTARLQSVRQIERAARASDDHLGTLFASLQHRAFRGEL